MYDSIFPKMNRTYTSRPALANRTRRSDRNQTESNGYGVKMNSSSGPTTQSTGTTTANAISRQHINPTRPKPSPFGSVAQSSQFGRQMQAEPVTENKVEPMRNRDVSPQRTLSYQGGYSVLQPDEKKRQTIQDQARRESEAYEAYKQQSRPAHVSYVGSVGGGLLDENAARKKTIQESSKYSRIQKQQQYKDSVRDRENFEINRKKMEARKKADMNEERKISEQKHGEQTWKRDHKIKNEEFLKTLENQSLNERQTSKKGMKSTTIISSPSCEEPADDNPYQQPGPSAEDLDSRVRGLAAIFPNYDMAYLGDLLSQTNSVDAVIDLLQS